tara:strand:+ start:305 stop:499 length:195 start_codon:yes stop_codon:yes gene_type:complete
VRTSLAKRRRKTENRKRNLCSPSTPHALGHVVTPLPVKKNNMKENNVSQKKLINTFIHPVSKIF